MPLLTIVLNGLLSLTACGGDDAKSTSGGNSEPEDSGTISTVSCDEHVFEDITIAARDGNALAAWVRKPTNPDCQLPTVLIYTPYGKKNARDLWFTDAGTEPLFDSHDYAFVVADWRGRNDSDGTSGGAEQNGKDGYDIVEWIAEQPFSDGHVGMYGASAVGGIQFTTAEQQPPHLSAIVPIFAAPTDGFEHWMPGGVVRKEYLDAFDILFGTNLDFFRDHPTNDNAWQNYVEPQYHPEEIEVPVLHVHGFFDLSAQHTLTGSEALTQSPERRLLIGEWHHFASGGEADWGTATEPMDEQELLWWDEARTIQIQALAFYDRHLRGIPSEADDWAPVQYQRGTQWLDAESWPPPDAQQLTLYLGDGTLQDTAPASVEIDFPYDPEDPSPTIGGQTLLFSYGHGPDWQDDVVTRDDALVFVTDELTEAVDLAGPIAASLQVGTTGTDTHFAIRITDVYPDGRHLMLTDGIRRMALYAGLETLMEIDSGERYTVPVDATNPAAWRFEAGHQIGLIVTSSHYSRFEKASNTGTVFYEDAESPVAVTNTLVLGESTLTLTVAP